MASKEGVIVQRAAVITCYNTEWAEKFCTPQSNLKLLIMTTIRIFAGNLKDIKNSLNVLIH